VAEALKNKLRPSPASAAGANWWPLVATVSVLGYLGLFLSWPTESSEGVARGLIFFAALLRPEDFVAKWFEGASWVSFGEHLTLLMWAAAVLSAAAGAGWMCLRVVRADRLLSRLEMTVLSIGVGLNVVSLVTLTLGLAGLLRRDLFIVLGIGVCVAAAATRRWAGCESGTCRRPSLDNEQADATWNWSPRWLWLLAPFVIALVGSAMTPPLDFDVREYHLQAPKEFYQAGRVTFLPHNVYANMPLGTEMLALAGMVVSDDWWTGAMVGKTLIALFAPLGALLLYAAGRRFATPAAGIVAALVYISIPWVAIVSSQALVEGAFAFYLFAALYGVLIWRQAFSAPDADVNQRHAALAMLGVAGFLAGSAVSTKYPAVLYCAAPLTLLVIGISWRHLLSRTLTSRMVAISLLVFLLAMVLGCGVWFAKNAAFTGNPTYPLLYRVFGGEEWSVGKEQRWQDAHRPPPYQADDLAERLWQLALVGTWISPLVVPLAVLAFFEKRAIRLTRLLAIAIAFIFISWWLLTHRIDRFLVPIWPLAAMLAGIGATWNATLLWRRTLWTVLVIGLAYDFVLIAGGPVADNRYLMSLVELRAESVRRVDPWHEYLNAHAGEIKGVLLVGDAQPFDLEVPNQYNTVFDRSIFEELVRDHSPEEVRKALLDRGISHIYVSWPEIARYRSPGNYGITEFLQPRIFADLVAAGVLKRLPQLADHGGELYQVIAP
jgi:hypothetical protein